jgi:hypothetical protein
MYNSLYDLKEYKMKIRSPFISFLLMLAFALSACVPSITGTPSVPPTNTSAGTTPTAIPTESSQTPLPTFPAPTDTLIPTSPPAPTATAIGSTPTDPSATYYIDDRSTPSQVIVSFYNAINRKEYSRAYGYYGNPATTLGSFTSWANGYQTTASVSLVFGQISGDAGMSQIYYTVPVILTATLTDGTHANYAACYVVHESNPSVYGAPPISPMNIDRGTAAAVTILNTRYESVLSTACNAYPTGGAISASATGNSLSIDKNNFVDNRSGPIETVSSLLNAINLKQYVRAYSYFQDPAAFPGPYDPYAAGFADTDTITVTFGSVTSEGAAGSIYYKVPLAETVLTTTSATQIYVGCYTLRLAQPANQTTPPFQPMGIVSGTFSVATGSNLYALIQTACN